MVPWMEWREEIIFDGLRRRAKTIFAPPKAQRRDGRVGPFVRDTSIQAENGQEGARLLSQSSFAVRRLATLA